MICPLSKVDIILNKFYMKVYTNMEKIYNYKLSDRNETTSKDKKKENNLLPTTNNLNILRKKKRKKKKNKLIISKSKNNGIDSINKSLNINNDNNPNNDKSKEINIRSDKINENNERKDYDKKNLDIYIDNIIKYIDIKERRKYLSETELENLSYKHALDIDKRNRSHSYFSMLKEKNKIISIFLNNKDYNIITVKLSLFLLDFNISLTVNALFFNDQAIYEINQNEGSYDLSTQIISVIYSTLISIILGFLVELLALKIKFLN